MVDQAAARYVPHAVSWPAATTRTVQLPVTTSTAARPATRVARPTGQIAHAAGIPVWAQATPVGGPRSLRITTATRRATAKAGIPGVLLSVAPLSGTAGTTRIGIDYSGFADAYGGGFGSRLTLVSLPACALTTPQLASCRTTTPLPAQNDAATHTVSATVPLGAPNSAPKVIAATTSAPAGDGGGGGGTYSATSLKASGSWTAGGSAGSFTYSYPIDVPPAASTLVPTVSLDYDSGSVDGQTSGSQSQSSWIGDGWSSTTDNFVEQTFVSCSDSPEGSAAPSAINDDCYDGPILTLSLDGAATSLIQVSGNTWKSSTDNGDVVTHVTGADNGTGAFNTDYWKVTDRTGTTFLFGRNELPGWTTGKPTTNSVQTVPVYSAHPRDPCFNAAGFAQSVCTMAYRWNLDYVTDTHGNAMSYYYDQDTNAYAQNKKTTSAVSYVRDAHLNHIDYGFTDGNAYTGHAPDEVVFQTGERCLTAPCDPLNATNAPHWPDVPQDLICTAGASCQVLSPAFFSTVRLTGIVTQQWNGTGYTKIDSWALAQHFPPTGDGYPATLFLDSITRTGSDTSAGGTAVALPSVAFAGIALANRVDTTVDGLEPLFRYRISAVTDETGSVTGVDYELVNPCSAPVTLTPSTNTSSCFPVSWTPDGFTAPITDWFNKYVVQSVTVADNTAGSPTLFTGYTYLGGGAWHFDDNEVVQAKYRTYGQWRGYGEVQTRTGQPDVGPQTLEDVTYYRGMNADQLPGGATRSVTLTDSQGGRHTDTNQLAGQPLEDTQYLGDGGPVDSSTITSYWVSPATATRSRTGLPALTANAVEPVEVWTRQAITDTAVTTWRTTEIDTTYDTNPADPNFGMATFVYDHGDLADPSQAQCTATTYAPANTTANIVGLPAEVEVDAKPCGGASPDGASAPTAAQTNALTAPVTLSRPADVISDTRTFYDNAALAATWPQPANPAWPQPVPTVGDPSVVRQARDFVAGAFVYQTAKATVYDSVGRVIAAYDANGHETQTAYTMTNGLTTGTTVTNPAGQVTTTTLDPARALPKSTTDPNNSTDTLHYDGLGRLTAVWESGRSTSLAASVTYSYAVSKTAPTVITTNTLNRSQGVQTSTQLFDSLLRPIQTQDPTPQGGRLLTNTVYDSHGWVVKKNNSWWDATTTPNGTLVTAADNTIPNQDRYTLDGLGRTVIDESDQDAVAKQVTTTVYSGDRTTVVPPQGGVAQSTLTDARGRTTELDQYTTLPTVTAPANTFTGRWSVTGGTIEATKTKYDERGNASDTIDPAGNDNQSTYDLLGNVTSKHDPDAGTSSLTYDPVGNLLSTTDANGNTTSFVYDALNRKVAEYDAPVSGQAPGNELAAWSYDGPASLFEVGKLVSSTAFVGGATGTAYTEGTVGYNAFGESLGETVTIPSTTGASADAAGQTTAVTTAGAGDLAGTYEFDHDYDSTVGLVGDDLYPAGGGLPVEDVSHGYSGALDLPTTLAGYTAGVTYDAFGRVTQEKLNAGTNNAFITNTYDTHTGLLTDSAVTRTTVPKALDDTQYTYDPDGNITSQSETRQGTTQETQCYTYDHLDRLTQAWTATDSCAAPPTTGGNVGDDIANGAYWTSWEFNALGERTSETDHAMTAGGADTTTTYSYDGNGAGQPTTLTGTSTTGPNGTSSSSYTYDHDGNTTGRVLPAGGQALTWTTTGRLATDTVGTTKVSYVYDADGNQLLRQDGTTTTLYLPGEQLVLHADTGIVTGQRFIALPGGGQAVRTGGGSSYSFEIADQHGTSTLTLNNTGQTPTWRQFTPYGAPRGTTPVSWPDQNGFLGDPADSVDGLTAIGDRQYDPTTGQFISLDPDLNASDPQSLNGYTYADENPVTHSDPTGDRVDDTIPGLNAFVAARPGDTKTQHYALLSIRRYEAHARERAFIREVNHRIYERQLRIAAQHAREVARRRAQQRAAEQRAAARRHTWFGLLLLNVAAGAADLAAAAVQVVPGLDVVADAGAGYLDEEAISADVAEFAAGDAEDDEAVAASSDEDAAAGKASCNSFQGTTMVLMADGTSKPIDQVHVGDKVENARPGSAKDEQHKVTAVHVTHDDRAYTDVTVKTGHGSATITGTAYHLYWDATTRKWTQARQLRIGDHLQSGDGGQTVITAMHSYTTTMVTYNLTIDTLHTYYVEAGSTSILVHNCGGPDVDKMAADAGSDVRPGVTKASRAYQKHMGRPNTSLIKLGGKDARDMSDYLVKDLLTSPRTAVQSYTHSSFGPVHDLLLPDIGARFTQSGDFIGFLDP